MAASPFFVRVAKAASDETAGCAGEAAGGTCRREQQRRRSRADVSLSFARFEDDDL